MKRGRTTEKFFRKTFVVTNFRVCYRRGRQTGSLVIGEGFEVRVAKASIHSRHETELTVSDK
jgi:hypothetical protein